MACGVILVLPPDDRDLRRRAAWMVAGGPLASLALALVGCGAHSVLGHTPASQISWFIGICSAAIFLATAIPSHLGVQSDGSRLIMLWRGGPKAEEWCALLAKWGATPTPQPACSSACS